MGLFACEDNEVEIRVVVSPDDYPSEILWTMFDSDGEAIVDGGPGEFTFCVTNGECRRWVINDAANDGICCNHGLGYYQIFVNDVEVQTGGDFGTSAEHQINCSPGLVCESALNVTEGLHGTVAANTFYKFTPAQTGEYKLSSCFGNPCESIVFVYEECLGTYDLTPIGAKAFNEAGCFNGNGFVQLAMQAGQEYYVRFYNQSCTESFTWQLTYEGAITGCLDESACNYDPFATIESDCMFWPNADCPGGLPDLELDQEVLTSSFQLDTQNVDDPCMINEGCASGYGERTILRFTTTIHNRGEADFIIGPTPGSEEDNNQFEWDQCHQHWHYEGYAAYELYDANNNPLPTGFKNGFCVMDLECPTTDMYKFDCGTMGISAGCTDIYDALLPCQWLDITGLEAGEYTMVCKINWDESPDLNGRLESDYSNNYAKVCFSYAPDTGNGAALEIIEACTPPLDCEGVEYGTAAIDCEGVCNGTTLTGDLNGDSIRNFEDVDALVQEIVGSNENALSACTDLNGDGELNIIDAYYLYACYKQTLGGGSDDPNNNQCGFPYGTYNSQHTTVFSNLGINYEESYVDIGILNSLNEVVAFEFNITGIDITSVTSIVDQDDLVTALNFNPSTGKITGFVISDEPIYKHTEASEFLRIHFDSFTGSQICVESIDAIVNELLEVVNPAISDACIVASGIGGVKQGDLSDLTISPNPFNVRTKITFPNAKADSFTISLYDAGGALVYKEYGIIEEELIIEGVAGGHIYTFLLESSDIYYTGKLICTK